MLIIQNVLFCLQDGGYNKILVEQHTFVPSGKVYNVSLSSSKEVPIKNGLCDMCNLNQQLKIQQLAQFVPISEGNYDKEIEQYRLATYIILNFHQ